MGYVVQIGARTFYVLRGNVHMHTTLSDGTRTHEELGEIASDAGLDFIVITDHNVYPPGLDAWMGDTLVLVGEEVHDPARERQSSHLLCFDIVEDVAGHAHDPQAVIDAVASQGGFTFLAHPFERDAAEFLPEPNISWRDWHVSGYAGIELWNYMSEFKGTIGNKRQAVLHAYVPSLAAEGAYPETLAKWDALLVASHPEPVAALGGSDAHGTVYNLGPLSRPVLPYDYLFRAVNTHLLSEVPLSGDVARDKTVVYRALRAGQGFLGNEQMGSIAGFRFWAHSGSAEATMGEVLALDGVVELRAMTPLYGSRTGARRRMRLLRDGEVVAATQGDRLTLVSHEPGVYRVEVTRRHAGQWRGWIYSNPIYVC
jgi:hypothetical protein